MKTFLLLILTFLSFVSKGQVIKLKIFYIDEKYPIIDTLVAFPGQEILDENNNSCSYNFDKEEFTIFLPKNVSNKNNDLILKFCLSNINLRIRNIPTVDTIYLKPLFLVSDDMIIKDVWYNKSFRFYKKLYQKKVIEFSTDSMFYCTGYFKGKRLPKKESNNFYFAEDGKWKSYNNSGQLITKMNFLKGRFNGLYEIILNDIGLHIKGQHKEGAMIGNWNYFYKNESYTWTFNDKYIIYDFKQNNR